MSKFLTRLIAPLALALFTLSSLVGPAMAASVAADVKVTITGAYTGANDLGTPTTPLAELATVSLTGGTGTGQADLLFADERTLAASATESLDLSGSLADPFGVTLAFVKVKCIYVFANAANTNNVIIGAAASNQFVGPFGDATDTVSVKPGGVFVSCHGGAGWAVANGSTDLLKIANSGGTTGVTYRLVLAGTTA